MRVNNRVSCIMPTYNRPEFVMTRLQEFYDAPDLVELEIIIVEDGTNLFDELELQNKFPHLLIKVIKLKENSGSVTIPRNIGISHSTGEFIAHTDDDVINMFFKFDFLTKKLIREPTAMLCHGKRKERRNDGILQEVSQPNLWNPLTGWGVDGGQFIYRYSIYDKIPFIFARRGCDWELAKAIATEYGAQSIASVPYVVSIYNWHSSNRSLDPKTKEKPIYPKKYAEYFSFLNGELPESV